MKKLVSMLLSVSLVFSMMTTTFAEENSSASTAREDAIKRNMFGEVSVNDSMLINAKPENDGKIKVLLNDEYIDFTDANGNVVEPQLINDRTMVPMRKIFEVFGAEVEWDGTTETVTATKEDLKIYLTINNPIAVVEKSASGESVELDSAPVIIDGRTLVPVRFIAETLDLVVGWDGSSNTVIIIDITSLEEILATKAPTFYEYMNNEFSIPESFSTVLDLVLNIKYTNSAEKSANTNVKFDLDAILNASKTLYELDLGYKATGKGQLFEQIMKAGYDNVTIDMLLDLASEAAYMKSSLLESEIGDNWLKIEQDLSEINLIMNVNGESIFKTILKNMLSASLITVNTYSKLEDVVDMISRFVSDEYFTVTGRTTKTYKYEITMDDICDVLESIGIDFELKALVESGNIKLTEKFQNNINTAGDIEIDFVINAGTERIEVTLEGDTKVTKINKTISIDLPNEKDVVEYGM